MKNREQTLVTQQLQNASLTGLTPLSEKSQGEAEKAAEAQSLNADPLAAVRKEADKVKNGPKKYGVLTARPMNAWIEESMREPDPETYFHGLFVEGETTVVFPDLHKMLTCIYVFIKCGR